MPIKAAVNAIIPSTVNAAWPTLPGWVRSVPGCMIHERMDISAMVMPLDFLANALRLRTWPRKATKTVVKDNSMLFANAAQSKEAVDGEKLLPLEIR
jgi:hypothetical protein